MEKTLYLFLLYFLLSNCCSNKINSSEIISNDFLMVNSSFEKFDKTELGVNENDNREVIQETINNKFINIGITSYSINVVLKPKQGWLYCYKNYYSNGYIRKKGVAIKTSDLEVKKEYEFDESGKLVKTTDYDKDYKTSFEQITAIAGKYGKRYGYQAKTGLNDVINDKLLWNEDYVKIWRTEYKNKRYWLIGFNKPHYKNRDDKKCERLVIVVDDAKGKIIKKEHYYDWYNRFLKDIDKLIN